MNEEHKEDDVEWESIDSLINSIEPLTTFHRAYIVSQIASWLLILGGMLSFPITLWVKPFLSSEPSVLEVLAALAAVQVVSGCFLCRFIANLRYKVLATMHETALRCVEIAAADQRASSDGCP